jgi:hypothetical protein
MASTFLPLTDDELLEKPKQAAEVMIGTWRDPKAGRFEAGIRNPMRATDGVLGARRPSRHIESSARVGNAP